MKIEIQCNNYNNQMPLKWIDKNSSNLDLVCYKISKEVYQKRNINDIVPELGKNYSGVYIYQGIMNNKEVYYIGRSMNLRNRIKQQHGLDKWNYVILITSTKNSLDSTKIIYLENQLILIARRCHGKQVIENKNSGDKSNASSETMELMDNKIALLRLVLCALGSNVFVLSPEKYTDEEKNEIFFCYRRGSNAEIIKNENGKWIVRKGSLISKMPFNEKVKLPKTMIENTKKARQMNIKSGKIENFVLVSDIEFNTPSKASRFVVNASSDGLNDWKNYYGIKLGDYLKKKNGTIN